MLSFPVTFKLHHDRNNDSCVCLSALKQLGRWVIIRAEAFWGYQHSLGSLVKISNSEFTLAD
jgi:hypothetical protein